MSLFDGEPGPLTLGQALVELAKLAPVGHDNLRDELVKTFATAFPDDVTPTGPAPNTGVTDPQIQALNSQAIQLANQAAELANMRAQLAEAQLAEARAKLAAINAGVKPSELDVAEATPAQTAAVDVEGGAPEDTSPAHTMAAASARTRGAGA
jgi:hypothetical protein